MGLARVRLGEGETGRGERIGFSSRFWNTKSSFFARSSQPPVASRQQLIINGIRIS